MLKKSLLPQFDIRKDLSEQATKNKLAKLTKKTVVAKSKGRNVSEKLEIIRDQVYQILGKYESIVEVISTEERLLEYIEKANKNGIIAIDTETNNSLDPITCKLMGMCLYTPDEKAVYVPINHTSYITDELKRDQLTVEQLSNLIKKLDPKIKIIMHNAKFDIKVIYYTLGIKLKAFWDTQMGAKLLNENEAVTGGNYKLKWQYSDKVDKESAVYNIETFFGGIQYSWVDPSIFALYSAIDAYATYQLFKYQETEYYKVENRSLLPSLQLEMEVLKEVVNMEIMGISIDSNYARKLSIKYQAKLDSIYDSILQVLDDNKVIIESYKFKKPNHKLSDPILISSPSQLATLLYDILKLPIVDTKTPRGTGEDILNKMDHPISKLILEYRGINKLLTTYINKLPNSVNEKTNRIHASFNQTGTDTGRFSSSEPNLQNIPSHNKEIRMLFVPLRGNVLVGGDFSQQEPRILAHFSGDEILIDAYRTGRDLYATVAARIYDVDYWKAHQINEDGTPNMEGKKLRDNAKPVVLGIMYGRGSNSIAEQLSISNQEAQAIVDKFYSEFPKVKVWIDNVIANAERDGYVTTLWGRRRRLPDIQLEPYEITAPGTVRPKAFNPLFDDFEVTYEDETTQRINYYKDKLNTTKYWKDKQSLKEQAKLEGLVVKDNSGFIAQAKRQAVNAIIQGSAADMSKRAMVLIHNDQKLKELGFQLSLTVHDELAGECPRANAQEVAKLLTALMIESANPECSIPMKCDTYIISRWYEDDFSNDVTSTFKKLCKGNPSKGKAGKTEEEAREIIYMEHSEIRRDLLDMMIAGTYECGIYEDIV